VPLGVRLDHVGPGPGLEVPADGRVAGAGGLDPADPVRLGEGHVRPGGQPAGGGADIGAPVQLDHPGPAAPALDLPGDRGRGRPPAPLPRPGLEPDQHPPGHERTRPGHERTRPGCDGAPDWEGSRTGWGRPRVVHSPGRGGAGPQGEAGQHHGEEQDAGERGPTG